MNNFSETDLQAFKLRFKSVHTNGKIMAFALPTGLDIFTLHPEFAKGKRNMEYKGPIIGDNIAKDSVIATIDGEDLLLPTEGKVIDFNQNLQEEIGTFALGPTSNYIILVKPNKGMRQLEDSYVKIC